MWLTKTVFFTTLAAISIVQLEGRCAKSSQRINQETNEIRITNRCPYTIWPGIVSYGDSEILHNGGFELQPYSTKVIRPQRPGWVGKIWGRSGCAFSHANGQSYSFLCETGDCGNGLCCRNWTLSSPATTVEISFGHHVENNNQILDAYSVSLSEGYNLHIQVRPVIGSYIKETNKRYDCNTAGCFKNLNSVCPPELAFRGRRSGLVIGCQNPCYSQRLYNNSTLFISDQYKSCITTPNALKFQSVAQKACPDVLVYDKQVCNGVVYTCQRYVRSFASYEVTFCP